MDNEATQLNMDISPAPEVSTKKKVIMLALIISVPIAAGLVAMVLEGTTLGLGVMWLIAGSILLTLLKWNWLKKYRWGARDNVKAFDEGPYRVGYWFLSALYIVMGIVFTVLGALSP